MVAQNPSLSRLQYLNKLFDRLEIIYNTITESSTDYNLQDQVLNTYKRVSEYRYMLYNLAFIYKTVCAQLRSSIIATTGSPIPS
jgi:hypothetical protein